MSQESGRAQGAVTITYKTTEVMQYALDFLVKNPIH